MNLPSPDRKPKTITLLGSIKRFRQELQGLGLDLSGIEVRTERDAGHAAKMLHDEYPMMTTTISANHLGHMPHAKGRSREGWVGTVMDVDITTAPQERR